MAIRKTIWSIFVTKTWAIKIWCIFFPDYPKYKIIWNDKSMAKIKGKVWLKFFIFNNTDGTKWEVFYFPLGQGKGLK